ncbi:hypothetical protein [Aurantiacibacter gilvus]|uniref:Uncharacterized protein n=1 Tax=Aurantiacibacter gilvus TaxID=3139141 RepID=A0ABU9ICU2_9SPHN
MSAPEITDEQIALLLQASREFAFEQMAAGKRVLPFGTRVKTDGEIEFVSLAPEGSEEPVDVIYGATRDAIASEAREGKLVAASLVAAVELAEPQDGFDKAIRIHLEAPGFVRQVLSPFSVIEAEEGEKEGQLDLGSLIPLMAEAELFTG